MRFDQQVRVLGKRRVLAAGAVARVQLSRQIVQIAHISGEKISRSLMYDPPICRQKTTKAKIA
jgi:hypothetical protein